ncbi:NUDIX domain-containing protein [Chryseobacterium carnipullorum]|uniref:NUDIX domain-containing protein n=1 Tax=Chryseobacterium carnipullorum TaxID=1124835 RepID=A0A376DQW8_CHRCU|nr:NUDIX domain-containing protein [Chryseobacterium carnipullorum]MDN5476839.1 NUDIX domain-containing protein [Chryseobacterium sp.]AZA49178.1 NUDIX domain-containing protein [Chryseobacterium carnipullorum]AZA64074.1 NUDIX domain-containing protein [Chryseobacterium carnipullorum]MDN5481701.1 NUDIX domain-containing protein [Chryseobacterium sp.]STC93984.1 Predicted NTP pyrophosphohydrolase [Chryseobacterium carnipullorum]
MYKVFVNEKKLLVSKHPENLEKDLRFESFTTLEIALDLLENTSVKELNVFGENIEEIWKEFQKLFRIIEAAGGLVTNPQGELLFIKRLGKWDLPKGKMEKGESREESAIREIEEETGLKDVELGKFINTTYHIYIERNGEKILKCTHWFEMNFDGEDTSTPQIEEGITEVAWKSTPQIKEEVFPSTFQNIKLIVNDFWNLKLK